MAGRIRTIKPELLEDEKACALSDAAWRLFVSSFLLADDHGRFRAGGRYLAASVWQDTGRTADAEAARDELAAAGRIRLYVVGSDTYAEIPTWIRHQRIDNASKPRIPQPGGNDYLPLPTVSRRVAASRGESRDLAALPPTSDLRPPTSDLRPPTSRSGYGSWRGTGGTNPGTQTKNRSFEDRSEDRTEAPIQNRDAVAS